MLDHIFISGPVDIDQNMSFFNNIHLFSGSLCCAIIISSEDRSCSLLAYLTKLTSYGCENEEI